MSESSAEYQRHPRDGVEALVDRLRSLEREVGELRNNLLKQAGVGVEPGTLVVDQNLAVNGNLEVNDGGRLHVKYPQSLGGGNAVYFGRTVHEDTREYLGSGLLVERPSGRDMMFVRTNQDGTRHEVQIRDNAGDVVFYVSAGRARGLSRPTLSTPMVPDYWQAWGSTESGDWVTVCQGYAKAWHTALFVPAKATASESGTAGEIRACLWHPSSGTRTVLEGTREVGFAIAWSYFEAELPATVDIGDGVYVELQARRTAGTGRIHAQAFGASWS